NVRGRRHDSRIAGSGGTAICGGGGAGIGDWNGQGRRQAAASGGEDSGGAVDYGAPHGLGEGVERSSAQHREKIQISGVRKAGDAGIFGGDDEGAFARRACPRAESCVGIRDEDFGREGEGGTRNRSGGAGKQRAYGVDSGRNRAAPRVLRLHGEISRRGNAPLVSGKIEASASEEDP